MPRKKILLIVALLVFSAALVGAGTIGWQKYRRHRKRTTYVNTTLKQLHESNDLRFVQDAVPWLSFCTSDGSTFAKLQFQDDYLVMKFHSLHSDHDIGDRNLAIHSDGALWISGFHFCCEGDEFRTYLKDTPQPLNFEHFKALPVKIAPGETMAQFLRLTEYGDGIATR
jgi:hypothetical protein